MSIINDPNYYLSQQVNNSGISSTANPAYMKDDGNTPLFLSGNYNVFETAPINPNVGQYFDGNVSKYDQYLGNIQGAIDEGLTINDLRADAQSGWDMAANALANNLVIAGTTAISGTVGTTLGLLEWLATGDVSKVWNNEVNNAMVDAQDYMKEVMPIYRGQQYEDSSIWDKLGTGIFWADLVENLGFTEGMLIPGMGMSSLLGKAPQIVQKFIPAFVSAMGEGAQEAINKRNEDVETRSNVAVERYKQLAQDATPEELRVLQDALNQELNTIKEDADNAGNFVYGANLAFLTLSNVIQFGDLFSRGAGTARRLNGSLRRTAEGLYTADSKGKAIFKTVGEKAVDAFTEGMEEVTQKAISTTTEIYSDYNHFNNSIFNPEKRELVGNLVSAFGQSYAETLQDPRTAEEFASGFIIGLLGVPTLRKGVVPITLQNNAGLEIMEAIRHNQREQELADQINTRLQEDPSINAYYDGLVRHLSINDDMQNALDNDDVKSFNDAKSAMFISDMMMFDEIGDLDRLREIINNSVDMSDEGIQAIIDAAPVGTFNDEAGNQMDYDRVREIIQEKQQKLNNKLDYYVKSKEELLSNYPSIDDATLKNALFLKSQYDDHTQRLNSLKGEVAEKLNPILADLATLYPDKDITSNIHPTLLEQYGKDKDITKAIDTIMSLGMSESYLSADDVSQLNNSLSDIRRLKDGLGEISANFKDILENPNKSAEKLEETKAKVVEEAEAKKDKVTEDYIRGIAESGDLIALRNAVNEAEDRTKMNDTLNKLYNEGDATVKDYIETGAYYRDINRAIDRLDLDDSIKSDAKELFNSMYNEAQNKEELSAITNIPDSYTFGEEEDAARYNNALYAVQKAVGEVNSREAKTSGLATPVTIPETIPTGTAKAPVNPTTGKEGTATTPPVSTDAAPIGTGTSIPLGDESFEDVANDNKKRVGEAENPVEKKGNRFLNPAVPYYHIEKRKQGNFNTFPNAVESGDFSDLFNELESAGAFEFVDEGGLKEGDEIGFMINPEFEAKISDKPWYDASKPTIFLVNKDGQVVGNLKSNNAGTHEGLQELHDRIRKEYNESGDKTKKFIATPKTKVSRMLTGVTPYTNEERSLRVIPNVLNGKSKPLFAFVDRGVKTNGKVSADKIDTASDNKEGRLYLLIPNGTGKYSLAATRTKHFTTEEYDIANDVELRNSPVGQKIWNALNRLVNARSKDEVDRAMTEEDGLKNLLYMGNNNEYRIEFVKDSYGNDTLAIIDNTDTQSKASFVKLGYEDNSAILNDDGTYTPVSDGYKANPNALTELIKELSKLNRPIQVDAKKINQGSYNEDIINSDILTSNIAEARVRGTWFTADYFDSEGNLQSADNSFRSAPIAPSPYNVKTPIGGKESAINGTPITRGGEEFYVDTKNRIVKDKNGKPLERPANILFDLATAQETYGDKIEYPNMMKDNNLILNDNTVLDRTNQKYITGETAHKIIDSIRNKPKSDKIKQAETVMDRIIRDQQYVDKDRTDSNYYYILEEDGTVQPYKRVHTVLGNNWNGTIDEGRAKLSTDAGTSVDKVVRDFFNSEKGTTITKPDNLSQEAFNSLLDALNTIRDNIEASGERFYANNLVLFHEDSNGNRIAGEVDILAIDKNGNFKIYDVKTSKYSFEDGKFETVLSPQTVSSKDYYTLQLSAYKDLLKAQYGVDATGLALIPFVINMDSSTGVVQSLVKQKGIPLKYNPAVNTFSDVSGIASAVAVPESSVDANKENSYPIFNADTVVVSPEVTTTDNELGADRKTAVFEINGKVHKGEVIPLGDINGNSVYLTRLREPNKDFKGNPTGSYMDTYYAVFPNGNTVQVIQQGIHKLEVAKKSAYDALSNNPSRVAEESAKETMLTKATPTAAKPNGAATMNKLSRASDTKVGKRRPKLREANRETAIWDKEKELKWLDRVLPQLSANDRVKVVNGLINVVERGAKAWGMFDNGIMTLSDIAAEGTAYHEAFHVVFDTMLTDSEKAALFEEAKKLYGDEDTLSLEEDMAEGFREYIMTRQSNNLRDKIKAFFEDLYTKVKNWLGLKPHLISYYYNINKGRYSTNEYSIPNTQNRTITAFSDLQSDIKDILASKGWNEELWNTVTQDERDQAIRCVAF